MSNRKEEDGYDSNGIQIFGVNIPWWVVVIAIVLLIFIFTELQGITRVTSTIKDKTQTLTAEKICPPCPTLSEDSIGQIVERITTGVKNTFNRQ